MPERKGRKRRAERPRTHGRGREIGSRAPRPEREPPTAPAYTTRPALRWRYAGFLLGALTMFFAVLTVAQGVSSSGANALFLLAVGSFLVALAVVLAALSLVPDRVRALFVRGDR
ncbi:MAG TPA: hypothetical protein VEZ14_10370 [Dehalococcoidia bacterium]|nr:hypothetical protein [Dehalococcoidia bacterium]